MDYFSKAAFQPLIPAKLITAEDKLIFGAFNITLTPEGESFSLFSSDRQTSADLNDTELTEDDLFDALQGIIRRSNGELPWVSMEDSLLCSKNCPDGFGGQAVFLTADNLLYTSTAQWLEQQIGQLENGVEMATSRFCGEITVIDPDTGNEIELEVHKDSASGGMFAIDASYTDLVSERIPSPFNEDGNIRLADIPEDWKRHTRSSAAIMLEILSEVEGVVTFSNGIATLEDGTELLIAASVQDEPPAVKPIIVNPLKDADKAYAQICAVTAQACMCSSDACNRIAEIDAIIDGLTTPAPAAKLILGIIVEGGLVQRVVSNTPDLVPIEVLVIDYDADGADPDEIIMVRQADGTDTPAVGHGEEITLATIDLETTLANL